jgi:hypothetical protein
MKVFEGTKDHLRMHKRGVLFSRKPNVSQVQRVPNFKGGKRFRKSLKVFYDFKDQKGKYVTWQVKFYRNGRNPPVLKMQRTSTCVLGNKGQVWRKNCPDI